MYVKFEGGRNLSCTSRAWNSGKHSWIDEESSKGVRLLCLACVAATSDCVRVVRLGERVDENRPNLPP